MITEIAILDVKENQNENFESNFREAEKYLSFSKGYIDHKLLKCIESKNKYLLIVNWETLEDHIIGFRKSENYSKWKNLLHQFYDPFPEVLHFE